ncbi:uncharacterized protein BP01DRAFT_422327 [Aspergillus saccharolyticus JOP 1030-1]|uniref:Uncharacterized protein n=1 Tax=Aspergillus saccharolyticus JOP 1030-1 TaxID=1450539 RepID=A0A319AK11_9EURO|nr:hypothetical protein BP01DRAFT_422327 [Aspergillus saccharolyticus JOP 1030-1]PYH46952.1 hypothetical protein BP01DRAFT_422327 [Aspergillus saccharolyticus JOP 1030-1]
MTDFRPPKDAHIWFRVRTIGCALRLTPTKVSSFLGRRKNHEAHHSAAHCSSGSDEPLANNLNCGFWRLQRQNANKWYSLHPCDITQGPSFPVPYYGFLNLGMQGLSAPAADEEDDDEEDDDDDDEEEEAPAGRKSLEDLLAQFLVGRRVVAPAPTVRPPAEDVAWWLEASADSQDALAVAFRAAAAAADAAVAAAEAQADAARQLVSITAHRRPTAAYDDNIAQEDVDNEVSPPPPTPLMGDGHTNGAPEEKHDDDYRQVWDKVSSTHICYDLKDQYLSFKLHTTFSKPTSANGQCTV